jgi:hypothetical protein
MGDDDCVVAMRTYVRQGWEVPIEFRHDDARLRLRKPKPCQLGDKRIVPFSLPANII